MKKVANAIIIDDDKILLIKRRYGPFKRLWCFPGGFLDKNESLENCCIREIKEETGIEVEIIKKTGLLKWYNKQKERDEEIYFFSCRPLSKYIKKDDEVLNAKWIELNKLYKIKLVPGLKRIINKVEIEKI